MSNLEVVFHVPKSIEMGLNSGALQRVGGVIVESSSKRVVAWLRDGTLSTNNPFDILQTAAQVGGNLNPASSILNIARIGSSLYDGHRTRQAISELYQQTQTVTAIATFTATGQILNLALTAASFRGILKRLEKLSEEITNLHELIRSEFKRERDMRFRVALEAARDVFESANETHRDHAFRAAVNGLYEARENFFADFQHIISEISPDDGERLKIAQHCLIRAMYAETSRIRCYLEINDLELAKQRLSESIPRFLEYTQTLVKLWFGEHPSIYFHKDVPLEELERFLQIQLWLQDSNGILGNDNGLNLLKVIDERRADFWNMDIIRDEYANSMLKPIKQIARRPKRRFSDYLLELPSNLSQAEAMIENYQRLIGFEMELRTMRLSFNEWREVVSEEDLQKHGIAMILNPELFKKSKNNQSM